VQSSGTKIDLKRNNPNRAGRGTLRIHALLGNKLHGHSSVALGRDSELVAIEENRLD
jgi:hypothetical protein